MKITKKQLDKQVSYFVARGDLYGAEVFCTTLIRARVLPSAAQEHLKRLKKRRNKLNEDFSLLHKRFKSALTDEDNEVSLKLAKHMKENYPSHYLSWRNLTKILLKIQHHKLAEIAATRGIELNPYDYSITVDLMEALISTQNADAAHSICSSALSLWGEQPELRAQMQKLHAALGDRESEIQDLLVLQNFPKYRLQTLKRRVEIEKLDEFSPMFSQIEREANEANEVKEVNLSIDLNWIAAKMAVNGKNYRKAAKHYKVANELGYDFKKDSLKLFHSRFTKSLKFANASYLNQNVEHRFPIFIVGLPRSGTSLLEQVFSSVPTVAALGELPSLEKVIDSLENESELKVAAQRVSDFYFQEVSFLTKKEITVDKMPHNYLAIGAIARCLPKSKILYLKRDFRAVGWSHYKSQFGSAALNYSYDLESIIWHFKHHAAVMNAWRTECPEAFFEVDYEEMVRNPIDYMPKVFEYCNLPFEGSYLDFQKNNKMTLTASIDQVRKGIYRGSSEEWRNYAAFFPNFFEELGQLESQRMNFSFDELLPVIGNL